MSRSEDNVAHAVTAIEQALLQGPDVFGPFFRPVQEMMLEWRRTTNHVQVLKERVSSLEKRLERFQKQSRK